MTDEFCSLRYPVKRSAGRPPVDLCVPACSQPQILPPARTHCSPDCAAVIHLPVRAQQKNHVSAHECQINM